MIFFVSLLIILVIGCRKYLISLNCHILLFWQIRLGGLYYLIVF